jgi:hypothetical protein
MYCLHTLAYSFVDKDRLFLRPTVRGRGVNVSIEEVTGSGGARVLLLALTTMRDLNIYNFKRALPRMVLFSILSFLTTTASLICCLELDAREPLQPLAAFSWRTCKRNQLLPLTKIALPAALDREASHSCLSRRLYH